MIGEEASGHMRRINRLVEVYWLVLESCNRREDVESFFKKKIKNDPKIQSSNSARVLFYR
jgi:hypothetical protein